MLHNFRKVIPTIARSAAKQGVSSQRAVQLFSAQDGGGRSQDAGFSKLQLVAAGLATLFACDQFNSRKKTTESCGIVGICGSHDTNKFLMEGLTILQNRGYDSVGIASIPEDGHTINVTKFASTDKSTADSIALVREHSDPKHSGDVTGIGHTRWATHGGRTDENAHPHCDAKNRVAVVHNGTINNHNDLRKMLIKDGGVVFNSQTDTEVIAQLIGYYMDKDPNLTTKDAVAKALSRCEGTWGLGVINKAQPDEIVVACNGSPMVIGFGSECTYVASETSAFNRYTKNFIAMKDGELAVVSKNSSSFDLTRIEQASDSNVLLTPDPYPHFTLKECYEQPESIARAMSYGARFNGQDVVLGGLDAKRDILNEIDNLMMTGCGTSKFAAEFGAKLMRELGCFHTVSVMDSAEVRTYDIPHHRGAVMAVSQSGETKDVHRAIKLAQDEDVLVATVVNTVGSLIARTSNLGVYLNAGREQGVASTKAFTSQVTVLALIALWFRNIRDDQYAQRKSPHAKELHDALQRLPISFGMALRKSHPKCVEIAKELVKKEHMFVLGKGYGEPIALEGALKLKEITYIHAEGYSGGALKHGPFALIEDEKGVNGPTPIICIILDDEHAGLMKTCAEEVKSRGAKLYVITDNADLCEGLCDDPIVIPNNGILTALLAVLPMQLIAYELAVLKGIDPDVPRNLAKAVTVD